MKGDGVKFRLVISGGVNHHFPEYERSFQELLRSYSDIIDEYLGFVTEKEIMKIFLNANLLILPYNTSGGHSGVLEQAIFFEVPTIAMDFPEYREQAMEIESVVLISSNALNSELIIKYLQTNSVREINVMGKILESQRNMKCMLK